MNGEQATAMVAATPASGPSRAQLPDVARLTGVPERTLQHWFREYSNYRSRRGYPTQLILDVLRDHEWEGDSAALAASLEGGAVPEQAIERQSAATPDLRRDYEERLAALAEQCERLATELTTLRTQHLQAVTVLLSELRQTRAASAQTATLNELRGVREDLLVLRAGQRGMEQQLAALAAKRRWPWPFRRGQ